MEPSINLGAHFLATPLAYGAPIPFLNKNIPPLRTPGRGDLIVLQPSGISEDPRFINWIDEIVGFFTLNKISIDSTRSRPWENREVVKRIIAIPGDTVRMTNFRVEIKIPENGGFRSENQVLENFEPIYPDFPPGWDGTHPFSGNLEVLTLGKDEYFVLSDNRGVGLGSTYLGPIKRDEIKKFVILKYLPWPLEILK